ncbi:hypothetical protein EV401DRAFT_1893262 [Pisolithus croceorrhizus]|nr:hypothetical protein EV401DRAFT_1893262 [Pisolithus croceorrhizus]
MSNVTPPLPFALTPIIHPVTPNNTSANSGNASQQILATYTLLSPASKASLDISIDRECVTSSLSHWANIPHALPFDLDEDAPAVTPDATTLPVSNLINNLANSSFHIPLSLFLYSSLYKLQNQPLAIKTIKTNQPFILNISLLMNTNLATKALRIPFKAINAPLPPASSVCKLVTNSLCALKRLCRKVNKHSQNAKTLKDLVKTTTQINMSALSVVPKIMVLPTINPLNNSFLTPFLQVPDLFPPWHIFSGFSPSSASSHFYADPDFSHTITP